MLVVKGIAVGTLLWFIGIIIDLGFSLFCSQVQTNHATGLSAVKGAMLCVYAVETIEYFLGGANGFFLIRMGAIFALILGFLGLTLAIVGVYGVVSYRSQPAHAREVALRRLSAKYL